MERTEHVASGYVIFLFFCDFPRFFHISNLKGQASKQTSKRLWPCRPERRIWSSSVVGSVRACWRKCIKVSGFVRGNFWLHFGLLKLFVSDTDNVRILEVDFIREFKPWFLIQIKNVFWGPVVWNPEICWHSWTQTLNVAWFDVAWATVTQFGGACVFPTSLVFLNSEIEKNTPRHLFLVENRREQFASSYRCSVSRQHVVQSLPGSSHRPHAFSISGNPLPKKGKVTRSVIFDRPTSEEQSSSFLSNVKIPIVFWQARGNMATRERHTKAYTQKASTHDLSDTLRKELPHQQKKSFRWPQRRKRRKTRRHPSSQHGLQTDTSFRLRCCWTKRRPTWTGLV